MQNQVRDTTQFLKQISIQKTEQKVHLCTVHVIFRKFTEVKTEIFISEKPPSNVT